MRAIRGRSCVQSGSAQSGLRGSNWIDVRSTSPPRWGLAGGGRSLWQAWCSQAAHVPATGGLSCQGNHGGQQVSDSGAPGAVVPEPLTAVVWRLSVPVALDPSSAPPRRRLSPTSRQRAGLRRLLRPIPHQLRRMMIGACAKSVWGRPMTGTGSICDGSDVRALRVLILDTSAPSMSHTMRMHARGSYLNRCAMRVVYELHANLM